MTKEFFTKLIENAEALVIEMDRWDKFGISLFELPIGTIPWEIFDMTIQKSFNAFGVDWINWYLFERISVITHKVLPCYDEEGDKVFLNTADDLWEWVKDYVVND